MIVNDLEMLNIVITIFRDFYYDVTNLCHNETMFIWTFLAENLL